MTWSGQRSTAGHENLPQRSEQLALLARLGAPPAAPGGQISDKTPPIRYTSATSLRPQCNLPFIATEADLDQWLASLRTAVQAELKKGHRISL